MACRRFAKKLIPFLILCGVNPLLADEASEGLTTKGADCSENTNEQNCQNSDHPVLVVTARKTPFAGLKPTTQASSALDISKRIKVPATLTELVEGIPGVAENSQPGLYQVISIRGVSRQRILSLVDGVRLSGERRAGVAASFVDPLLLDSVEVIRGPVSTYYGSGAIGGVTQMRFRKNDGLSVAAGFRNLGNEQFQLLNWGDESTNFSLVRRQADNSQDINGDALNTHFEQTAAYLQKSWQLEDKLLESWLFSSNGNDIGRSNSRFPNRIVNVPSEKHQIFKASLTSQNKWSFDFYLHGQEITTATLRPTESLSELTASSLDWGLNWQTGWQQTAQSSLVGIDLYSRRSVNLKEQLFNLQTDLQTDSQTLNNGRLDELALFYTFNKKFTDVRIQLGGRYTFEQTSQFNQTTQDNNALTGFAGIAFDLSKQLEINANIGNAFRFASLSERFFSGTTARGNVTGNQNLTAEKAITYDYGFSWHEGNQKLMATYFVSDFDNYIERIEIAQDQLSFFNIENGKISGWEIEYDWMLTEQIDFRTIATIIEGKNTQGQPLADIPSDRVSFAIHYQTDRLFANFRLQHRFKKNETGSGELPTAAATILNASLSYRINHQWNLQFFADNLTNESYVSSADDLSTIMAGRNYGISFDWRQD